MPAKSKKQQKFMGIVRAIQKGEADPSDFNKDAQDAAKKMKKSSVKKYAKTKHKGLPTKKVSEGKLETLALNLLRNINKEIGISKYDHTKTAHFNKVMKFLRSKMPKAPDRKLGDIAMSYGDYRKKQPKATIPDIDSVKDMEKTLKSLGMKESVNEGRVLHFTQIKDKTLEKHLKVISKKVGATVSKISGGFKVDADNDGRKLAQVVDYIFDKSLMKGLMSGGGMSRVQLVNESNGSKRDYKAEYKKFQSSPKAKKYRAELNKYNRQKGTYGNGDGKDASHKGGKIVGFEKESTNRGRAEKSRLKKEINDYVGSVIDETINENPAAIAAAQRMVVQSKGKKISVNTARSSRYKDKDPAAHKKAKSMFSRLLDKFRKKNESQMLLQMAKQLKEADESVDEIKVWDLNEKCWKGYEKKGMKTMFGKRYPNCVKKKKSESVNEVSDKQKRKIYKKAFGKEYDDSKRKQAPLPLDIAYKVALNRLKKKKSESVNEQSKVIKSIDNLAKKNKYGTVTGTQMNGKTANTIMKIYNHPKMKKHKKALDNFTSDELVNLTVTLPKTLGIKESVNEAPTGIVKKAIELAKSMGGNMTGAIKRIEKIKKGLSKHKDVKKALRMANESINETPYELGGMKVYSKADGLKKVKSMQKTSGAKIYKVTKTKTKLYGTNPVTMYNLHTKNKNHSTNSNPYGLDMMKGAYLIPVKESINEQYFDPKHEGKKYMDRVLKKAGIRVITFDPMKKSFYNGIWGGFYTVASSNMTDMPGQGKVKRSSAVLPVYIDKKSHIELGVSGKGFKLGPINSPQVLKKLKSFKKSDLEESINEAPVFKYQGPVHKNTREAMKWARTQNFKKDYGVVKVKGGHKVIVQESINERAWTPAQEKAVKELDKKFYKLIGKKGIEPYSYEASQMWTSGGFRKEMRKIFGKDVKESVNENISDSQKFKIYNSLKKGDIVSIKYDSTIAKGSKFRPFLVTKGKTKLMKGKIERIIMIPADTKNKNFKRYLYNRNGRISLALGDMGAVIVDMKKGEVKESVEEAFAIQYKKDKRYLTRKELFDKKPLKFKTEDEAKSMLNGLDHKYRTNYKIVKIKEGTCGYGMDGKLGEEPAGPHLLKKKKKKDVNEARLDPKQLLQQLGGNKFIAMTGAKNLAFDKAKNTLHMKIGRNAKGVNHLRIKLTGADLYDMEFLQVRAGNVKVKAKEKGVYNDQLQKMFTKHTGMYTSL